MDSHLLLSLLTEKFIDKSFSLSLEKTQVMSKSIGGGTAN